MTLVAAYGVRCQRLLRFPIKPLLDRLAGQPIDMDKFNAKLATLIQDLQGMRAA